MAQRHFTFHVVSLPHTQTIKEQSWCAFTQKVRKFCDMMKSLDHTVYLYASEQNEAACDELITCMSIEEQKGWGFPEDMDNFKFHHEEPYFKLFNARAASEIQARKKPGDIICNASGKAQEFISTMNPDLKTVESGIGYHGVFAPYKVFESYNWMHMIYGANNKPDSDGQWGDAVIPNYFEIEDFDYQPVKADPPYLLYLGRLIRRKGVDIAIELAKSTNMQLKVAGGQGDKEMITKLDQPFIDYVGIVGPEKRSELMGGATALLCPTLYIEPFGGIAVEAQMCGTPAISTDWGAFPETVEPQFRCRSFNEFTQAIELAKTYGPDEYAALRARTINRYSTETIKHEYQRYFERITS